MKAAIHKITDSLLQLLYPHVCAGCGSESLPHNSQICLKCLYQLPLTHFEKHSNNPVEKGFAGRLKIESASSMYYFHKVTALQNILHALKYGGNKEVGIQLGTLLGNSLKNSERFSNIGAVVPLPLFAARQKARGYNQSAIIGNAVATILQVPLVNDAVIRVSKTQTQTNLNRAERQQNMKDKFRLINAANIEHKNVLLIDDIITTGATLESCGAEILKATNVRLSIATIGYASKI